MKVKAIKISTDIIRIIIVTGPSGIQEGDIALNLYIDKENIEELITLPYSHLTLAYDFNFSKTLPRNINDFDYTVKVSNESKSEETRKLRLFKKLPHHLSGPVKKIQHDFLLVAKNYNGSKALFFKKIPGEEQCIKCWDIDLEGSNNSNCPVCGGTGKMRYFSNPYKTYCGPIKWQQEAYSVDKPGKTISNPSVTISAIADMVLTTDDIIYYDKTAEFYRVVTRTLSEIQTVAVLQNLVANIIPSDYPDAEICRRLMEGK